MTFLSTVIEIFFYNFSALWYIILWIW